MDKIDSEQPLQGCSNNNKSAVSNGDGINNGTNAKCLEVIFGVLLNFI